MGKVGITAPAYNVDDKLIFDFKKYLDKSIIDSKLTCSIYLTSLESEVIHDSGKFSRSKALNSGIKELISIGCEVIICTDIDIIIPPRIIEYTYNKAIQTNCNISTMKRNIDRSDFERIYPNWYDLMVYPASHSDRGSWNAMTSKSWINSGGWPEELYDWGFEDVLFHEKLKYKRIDNITLFSFPLIHLDHPPRTSNQFESQRNNIKISNQLNIYDTNWI